MEQKRPPRRAELKTDSRREWPMAPTSCSFRRLVLAGVAALLLASPAGAASLRVGLQEDPDILDPAQGVSFVGREVFAALCDKLVDVDRTMTIVPQLATEWSWAADGLSLTLK